MLLLFIIGLHSQGTTLTFLLWWKFLLFLWTTSLTAHSTVVAIKYLVILVFRELNCTLEIIIITDIPALSYFAPFISLPKKPGNFKYGLPNESEIQCEISFSRFTVDKLIHTALWQKICESSLEDNIMLSMLNIIPVLLVSVSWKGVDHNMLAPVVRRLQNVCSVKELLTII